MNTLVFTYGNAADLSNSSIASQVLNNTANPPVLDVKLANSLLIQTASAAHTNGSLCDDGNSATHGEYWFNDICQGGVASVYLDGSACDDGNPATTGDTWLNDVCQGGGIINVYVNGTPCNDGNPATIGETWLNDICQGGILTIYTNGTACNDGNAATIGEKWLNGVCLGGVVGNLASNGLIYDNCEGGGRTLSNAITYCTSKGMRLPKLGENVGSGGVIDSCPSWYTWTSKAYDSSHNYVFWSGSVTNIEIHNLPYVRCVK